MSEHMVRELGEQVQERGPLRKIEPYYNDLYQGRPIRGRWNPKAVLLNGSWQPPGMATSMLKVWHKLFHTEWIPVGGNYMLPFAAKVRRKILGMGKDFIRRRKEQERTDLGSQV